MYRIVFNCLSSLVLTMSVLAGVSSACGKEDVAVGGELNFSVDCKGLNVAYARFGNCGYGHFLGYSFGSGKTSETLLVPLQHGSMAGGEDEKSLTCSAKTDYCGFSEMGLVYNESRKLWRIILSATGNEDQMLKMAKSVRKDLVLTYGLRQQDWTRVRRDGVHGFCAILPGELEMMVLVCRASEGQMRLEVVVQNRRVIETIKKEDVGSGDVKVNVDV